MISLNDYLVLSALLFFISLVGIVINRKNLIIVLLCIELLLLAVSTNFLAFSAFWGSVAGQIFTLIIIAVTAAETAVGLAILILLYRNRGTIDVRKINILKE